MPPTTFPFPVLSFGIFVVTVFNDNLSFKAYQPFILLKNTLAITPSLPSPTLISACLCFCYQQLQSLPVLGLLTPMCLSFV